jgi:hypothetical protein
MAEAQNTIRLNPTKPSELEFEVSISGIENIAPVVRLVIKDVQDGVDWVVKCKKLEESKWQANFPAFPDLKLNTLLFAVEVIVEEEYYFKPAQGSIIFVTTPDVSFKAKAGSKPTVSASFTVKQDEDPTPSKKDPKKKVSEASGGMEITGQFNPNNSLLKKEEDPARGQSHTKMWDANQNDEFIDRARLDMITDAEPVPGDGSQYPQSDGKSEYFDTEYDFDDTEEDDSEEENPLVYDPNKIARNILKDTIGKAKAPSKLGSLFRRGEDGKIIVPGLESEEQKELKAAVNSRIRNLIK